MVAGLHLSPVTFFTLVRFHPVPLLAVLAGVALYWRGVRQVRSAGHPWPRARVAAFTAAVAVVAIATLSGMDAFVPTSFTIHAVAQMGLFMLAPPLLALSAPITLAMEAGGPARAARVLRLLGSPVAKVVAHPVTAWALYGGALFTLYFSGQYRLGVERAWVLQLTNLELLAVGLLFAEVVIGADPKPHRLAIGWRILYLMVSTIFYSILGMAMQSQTAPIAPGIRPSDMHTGGGDLWSAAELFTIAATIAVLIQWLMVDEGHARRADRVNAEEDAAQLAAWRAARREAALADVRASESVIARSRPAGSDRSDRSFASRRAAPGRRDAGSAAGSLPVGRAEEEPA